MIEFMKSNYYDPYIAQYIHPKSRAKVKLKIDKDFIFNENRMKRRKTHKDIDNFLCHGRLTAKHPNLN
jgi:hypothetical protein